MVETNRTKDTFLASCLGNLWLLTVLHDMEIEVKHIPGKNNQKVDMLSRIYSNTPVDEGMLQENYIWENFPVQYFDFDLHL